MGFYKNYPKRYSFFFLCLGSKLLSEYNDGQRNVMQNPKWPDCGNSLDKVCVMACAIGECERELRERERRALGQTIYTAHGTRHEASTLRRWVTWQKSEGECEMRATHGCPHVVVCVCGV